jgi:hypothetical protein
MPSRRTRAPNSQLEPSYRSPCDPRQVEHLPSSLWPASPDLTLAEYRYADRRGAGTHIYNFRIGATVQRQVRRLFREKSSMQQSASRFTDKTIGRLDRDSVEKASSSGSCRRPRPASLEKIQHVPPPCVVDALRKVLLH